MAVLSVRGQVRPREGQLSRAECRCERGPPALVQGRGGPAAPRSPRARLSQRHSEIRKGLRRLSVRPRRARRRYRERNRQAVSPLAMGGVERGSRGGEHARGVVGALALGCACWPRRRRGPRAWARKIVPAAAFRLALTDARTRSFGIGGSN